MNRASLVEALLRAAARVPLPLLHGVGSAVGMVAAAVPNDARHYARVNAQLCFGDRPLAERKALVRCALRETAKGALETGPVWFRPLQDVLGLVRRVENESLFNDAVAAGRGLLILAPHLGCWEVLQAWIGQRVTANALYRPPRQAEFEELITRARSRTGVRFWPTTAGGVRALFKALRNGEAVGVLPDQQPPGEGVFAPFFGYPAKTMTLFGKLAARSGAPVLLGWAERLPRGQGFVVHWQETDEAAIGSDDPETAAAAMNREIERAARRNLCQYQWTYRRFSRQPARTRNPYRRYRSRGGWVAVAD